VGAAPVFGEIDDQAQLQGAFAAVRNFSRSPAKASRLRAALSTKSAGSDTGSSGFGAASALAATGADGALRGLPDSGGQAGGDDHARFGGFDAKRIGAIL
jgi:hypothetical protein